jgi:hypothetical protein
MLSIFGGSSLHETSANLDSVIPLDNSTNAERALRRKSKPVRPPLTYLGSGQAFEVATRLRTVEEGGLHLCKCFHGNASIYSSA